MAVVCPKPRRYGLSIDDHLSPFRKYTSIGASQVEAELLDIILKKENNGGKGVNQMAFSPPFLLVSPPSRASNPLVEDEQFHKWPLPSASSAQEGRYGLKKFRHEPAAAAIRVEGFAFA